MARENGGGALGWTLLGFLAGIAATLGVQMLIPGGERPEHAASSATVVVAPPSAPPPVAPTKKKAAVASAAPAHLSVADQPDGQVADDAAAAGMTSRTTVTGDPSADRTAPASN
jgi:hypothetical protein